MSSKALGGQSRAQATGELSAPMPRPRSSTTPSRHSHASHVSPFVPDMETPPLPRRLACSFTSIFQRPSACPSSRSSSSTHAAILLPSLYQLARDVANSSQTTALPALYLNLPIPRGSNRNLQFATKPVLPQGPLPSQPSVLFSLTPSRF